MILTLWGLCTLSVLVFFFIALPAPIDAVAIMNGFSILVGVMGLLAFVIATNSKSILSAGGSVLFALFINPYVAHFFGYEFGTTAILGLCMFAGGWFAQLSADRDEGYVRRQVVSSLGAMTALVASCGCFLYWYGNPYNLETASVIAITISLFAISYTLVSWAENELKWQQLSQKWEQLREGMRTDR